ATYRAPRRSTGRAATAEPLAPSLPRPCELCVRSWAKAKCRQVHDAGGILPNYEDTLANAERGAVLRVEPVGCPPEEELVGDIGLVGVVNRRQVYIAIRSPGNRDAGATPGKIARASRGWNSMLATRSVGIQKYFPVVVSTSKKPACR